MKKRRSHKLRNGVLGLGGLGGLAYLLVAQCEGGLGLLNQGADWAREKIHLSEPADAAPPPPDAEGDATRCELRLDADGLALAGEPTELDAAVADCKAAGAADLTVTGDARYGSLEELEAALEAAGVDVYIR